MFSMKKYEEMTVRELVGAGFVFDCGWQRVSACDKLDIIYADGSVELEAISSTFRNPEIIAWRVSVLQSESEKEAQAEAEAAMSDMLFEIQKVLHENEETDIKRTIRFWEVINMLVLLTVAVLVLLSK